MKIKGMIIGLVAMATLLAIPMTSDAAVIIAINARRQRVVNIVQVQRVRQVAVVQQVQFLSVFQPVQAVSFVPLVQVQQVYGQYAPPAQIRTERIIEKVDATGRVIERIIER